jgi:hypothetical protein
VDDSVGTEFSDREKREFSDRERRRTMDEARWNGRRALGLPVMRSRGLAAATLTRSRCLAAAALTRSRARSAAEALPCSGCGGASMLRRWNVRARAPAVAAAVAR